MQKTIVRISWARLEKRLMGIMTSYTKSIVDDYFLFIFYYSLLSKPDEVVLVSVSEKLFGESENSPGGHEGGAENE